MTPLGHILRDLRAGASTVDALSLRLKLAPEIVRNLLEREASAQPAPVSCHPLFGTDLMVWRLTDHGRSGTGGNS